SGRGRHPREQRLTGRPLAWRLRDGAPPTAALLPAVATASAARAAHVTGTVTTPTTVTPVALVVRAAPTVLGVEATIQPGREPVGTGLDRSVMRHDHVAGLGTLGSLLGVERDLVTLVEGPEAVRLDGGEVDEDVFPALVLSDETVALLTAEPLDLACRHDLPYRPVPDSGGYRDCLVS